jgi:protein-disulfide isomerase
MTNEKKKKDKPVGMKLVVILTVVALGIIAAIVVLTNQKETTVAETAQIDIAGQPTIGESEAPVTVVEFGDFKCPTTWAFFLARIVAVG